MNFIRKSAVFNLSDGHNSHVSLLIDIQNLTNSENPVIFIGKSV